MDALDRKISAQLQDDGRATHAAIGQAVGLSVSAVNERVRKLAAGGAIAATRAILDPEAMGLSVLAFLFVDLDYREDEAAVAAALARESHVLGIFHVTGAHSYLLKVIARDTTDLQRVLSERIKTLPGIVRTETFVVLETLKDTTVLPLATEEPGRDD